MPEIDPKPWWLAFHDRFTHGLGTKLIGMLLGAMLIVFTLLGYLTIRLHRQHLETAALVSAERMSDVIKRSTTYYMLRNDREGVYHTMATMANEPEVVRVRVFDREGKISYSTEPSEISRVVDKAAEACYGCHSRQQPLAKLNRPDRFRVYRSRSGARVLAIVTPIENQTECSNAACHAHPESQQILGVLDTHLSLAHTDQQLAQGTWQMLAYDGVAMAGIALLTWWFIRRLVDRPLKQLQAGTVRLSRGELGYQIELQSKDQIGELAASFNSMSVQLQQASEQVVSWALTLEDRVEEKTRELKRAHDEVLHVETMASLGKMAAVVAHEINNPLSGILTYAKLIKKWIDRDQTTAEKKKDEAIQCLDLIASESRRCGDLVKNLLGFSRSFPMNVEATEINPVVQQCILLVRHNLDHAGIQLHQNLADALPRLQCDPSQIEQVLLAVIMNAIEAMPRGGNLWIETSLAPDGGAVAISVRDDGSGIAPEVLAKIFEPFVTTKEHDHGTGLGLAVSRSIVERHSGKISLQSELGKGTTVTITLPAPGGAVPTAEPALAGAGLKTR